MTILLTDPRLAHPDSVYDRLIALHDGLSEAESNKVNASLILLLANHIGDEAIIVEAIGIARATVV